jgi:hypothetical protein
MLLNIQYWLILSVCWSKLLVYRYQTLAFTLWLTSWGYPALPGNATRDLLFWFAPNVCFDRGCMIVLKN